METRTIRSRAHAASFTNTVQPTSLSRCGAAKKVLTSLRFLLVVVYTVFLAVVATAPPINIPVPATIPILKWHHIGAFAVYVFLLGSLLHIFPRLRTWVRFLMTGLIAFTFGALIELVQRDIPYRSGQW